MPRFRAMTTLVDTLVSEELWAMVEPLLPPPPRPWWGGRIRTIPDRNCFAAIIYLVRTSTPWRLLPARELGCGSPAWTRPACAPSVGGTTLAQTRSTAASQGPRSISSGRARATADRRGDRRQRPRRDHAGGDARRCPRRANPGQAAAYAAEQGRRR